MLRFALAGNQAWRPFANIFYDSHYYLGRYVRLHLHTAIRWRIGSRRIGGSIESVSPLIVIQIDLAPVLLGGGVRLFENFGMVPTGLEPLAVVEGKGVTHLLYRVVK